MKKLLGVSFIVVLAGLIVYSAAGPVNASLVSPLSHDPTMQAEGNPLPFPHGRTTPESVILQAEGNPLPFPYRGTTAESVVLQAEGNPLPFPYRGTTAESVVL
jgi:hypothetical protein